MLFYVFLALVTFFNYVLMLLLEEWEVFCVYRERRRSYRLRSIVGS